MEKIAVFPAGTEIGLEINKALKFSKNFEIHGLNSLEDHSKLLYENYFSDLPFYYEENFIDLLNIYLEINKINYLYPAHDDVLLFMARNSKFIKTKVITTEFRTVEICRSKSMTYKHFQEFSFNPIHYQVDNLMKHDFKKSPIFSKPDVGNGSKGIKLLKSLDDFKQLNALDKRVFCEFLPGKEFTIDCFSNNKGVLQKFIIRERQKTQNGISIESRIIKPNKEIDYIAQSINRKLTFRGAWFFQIKLDKNGNHKLLEIAPRVSGTMGLSRSLGANFPLLTILDFMNISSNLISNNFNASVHRSLISRYNINIHFNSVYIDLDDTLIFKNKVNTLLLMLIYQFVNENISVHLITKHKENVYKTLEKFKINHLIFYEIIQIDIGDNKYKYISNEDSIFIDDSFRERQEVLRKLGIPVFDVSEVDVLINWRLL